MLRMYTDSHLHVYDLHTISDRSLPLPENIAFCASAHEQKEFLFQEEYVQRFPAQGTLSFGIHPQSSNMEHAEFLSSLVVMGRIQAIGECGFDLFDEKFKSIEQEQHGTWDFQVELAISSGLPLVVHCRKAMHLIFADVRRLKKIKAVVFHGWPGSLVEARSLLSRGVNAYFSAGKGILRGDRSLTETATNIPLDHVLTETDAPYMKGKNELHTIPQDIYAVTASIAALRVIGEQELLSQLYANFRDVFGWYHECVQVPESIPHSYS